MNNGSDAAAYTPETDERARRAATEVPRAGMAARTPRRRARAVGTR